MRPEETVQRILSVDFCKPLFSSMVSGTLGFLIRILDCLNRDEFDIELHQDFDPYSINDGPPYKHEHAHGADLHDGALDHPCSELKKILSGGTFYYSLTFDLTNRLQDR